MCLGTIYTTFSRIMTPTLNIISNVTTNYLFEIQKQNDMMSLNLSVL